MSKLFLIFSIFLFPQLSFAKNLSVSNAKSTIEWKGSKVIGGEHKGTLEIKDSQLIVNNKNSINGKIIVDMTTIKNTDLTDKEWNKKLVEHLKSSDFFDIKSYPTAMIEITKSQLLDASSYKIGGKLTIKGIEKPVELIAKIENKNNLVESIKTKLVFDRTDFNIRYGSGKFFDNLGDKMISDVVEVSVNLVLSEGVKLD